MRIPVTYPPGNGHDEAGRKYVDPSSLLASIGLFAVVRASPYDDQVGEVSSTPRFTKQRRVAIDGQLRKVQFFVDPWRVTAAGYNHRARFIKFFKELA